MNHFFETIPGNFTFAEIYRDAVRNVPIGGVLVEVGVWKGRSAAFMAVEIANSRKNLAFHCVDLWEATPIPASDYEAASFEEFKKTMTPAQGLYQAHISPSDVAASLFRDRSVDFVFIDADHSYEAVRRDILAWLPKVKVGGTLAGHDYEPYYPGVIRAVDELFPGRDAASCGQKSWRIQVRGDELR
jgi:hypothetical protein